jgi:ATP-dependent Clp endopeptidase proteolytic subunit ClpP
MTKKINDSFITNAVIFHEANLHILSRTVYFGGIGVDSSVDNDEVNCRTIGQLIRNLHILELKERAPISLLLNTSGGTWEDGIAAYDLIRQLKSPVNILGMGKIWSMGSIIFQSGTKRLLLPNTTMLIHDGTDGYLGGDAKSFENWAKDSKRVRNIMYDIYYEKMVKKNPNITLKDIEIMCAHDNTLTAKEAVDMGLADSIM